MNQCTASRFVRLLVVLAPLITLSVAWRRSRRGPASESAGDPQLLLDLGSERRLRRLAGEPVGVWRGADLKAVVCADAPRWVRADQSRH